MMNKPGVKPVTTFRSGQSHPDLVAVEEPLEIRIGYGPESDRKQAQIAVTMRTPGHDEELAIGFLFGEGIITRIEDILQVRTCTDVGKPNTGNVLRVELHPDLVVDLSLQQRNFYTTSSCGICGKASIEAVHSFASGSLHKTGGPVLLDQLQVLPRILQDAQANFMYTGGMHATGLFDTSGKLLIIREDVGRHNAMDKVVGAALLQNITFSDYILLLSGRISFELVQKAVMTGAPILAAVGAPSSLAVELAEEYGITLVGFLKEDRANIYSGEWRVQN